MMADLFPSPRSWWLDEALSTESPRDDAPPLAGEVSTDVVIVGGGYTGLWTARALKERASHLSITLLEADICGGGASGKNGGKVHGYWASLWSMEKLLGPDKALTVARMGTRAQDLVRAFATAPGRDVWWREGGNLLVSAAPAQDPSIARLVRTAARLGVADTAQELSAAGVSTLCRSSVFRGGVFLPEGATVHPARLARALRSDVMAAGVRVHEHTPMLGLDRGSPNRVRTPKGQVIARTVILATNVELARLPQLAPHVSVFSSYALMTEPAPARLTAMGWTGEVGLADLRMFLHYFRKTPDGRVLMGSGSGPISRGGRTDDPSLTGDVASVERAGRGLKRLLPELASAPTAQAWGGAIDVSADRLPIIGTLPGSRVHFACGFSGHGVNPTCLAAQVLASLALEQKDDWATMPLVGRQVPRLPPEPFRAIGGRMIRKAILACEEAEENDRRGTVAQRSIAALPRVLGLRIGTR